MKFVADHDFEGQSYSTRREAKTLIVVASAPVVGAMRD